jgi:hypothetical protein
MTKADTAHATDTALVVASESIGGAWIESR